MSALRARCWLRIKCTHSKLPFLTSCTWPKTILTHGRFRQQHDPQRLQQHMTAQSERTIASIKLTFNRALAEQSIMFQQVLSTIQARGASSLVQEQNHSTTVVPSEWIMTSRKTKHRASRKVFSVHLPGWLFGRVWNISMARASGGLNLSLQHWATVEPRAPVFEACEKGDLAEVRKLIASGRASPRDRIRSVTSTSLLDVSLMH